MRLVKTDELPKFARIFKRSDLQRKQTLAKRNSSFNNDELISKVRPTIDISLDSTPIKVIDLKTTQSANRQDIKIGENNTDSVNTGCPQRIGCNVNNNVIYNNRNYENVVSGGGNSVFTNSNMQKLNPDQPTNTSGVYGVVQTKDPSNIMNERGQSNEQKVFVDETTKKSRVQEIRNLISIMKKRVSEQDKLDDGIVISRPKDIGGSWGEFEGGYEVEDGCLKSEQGSKMALRTSKSDTFQQNSNFFIPKTFSSVVWNGAE